MIASLLWLACRPAEVKLDDSPPGRAPQTCALPDRAAASADVTVERAFPALSFRGPVAMIQPPEASGDTDWYLVSKYAQILRFADDPAADRYEVVLDLTDRVYSGSSEAGLLGAAFHPGWPDVPWIYLSYTDGSRDDLRSVVSRIPHDGSRFLPDQEEILLTIDQPFENHNGGSILFGPDGLLYLGFGDGGSSGDPYANGQDTGVRLGKILRIDVDRADPGLPWAVPDDNPFAPGGARPGDGLPEIYAWGLRNPWRASFDSATGDLWVGDVGQNAWEEIDIVERGGNYGWGSREGAHCYPADPCDTAGLIDPVAEYAHEGDYNSVVGGYVYRGSDNPALYGSYLYTDTGTARLYAAAPDPLTGAWGSRVLLENTGLTAVSFAEGVSGDSAGELYLLDYSAGTVHALLPGTGEIPPNPVPALLSETGCFDPADPASPMPGLLPYTVASQLWSDGADKDRWLALPDGTAITDDGGWEFPVGTVTAKHFYRDNVRLETRLMVRQTGGAWAGYSYAWRADGSDADRLDGALTAEIGGEEWAWPSGAQCMQCHTEIGGRVLGITRDQLSLQTIDEWIGIGALAGGAGDGQAPLSGARGWLDANCAFCHQPDGTGGGAMDLRASAAVDAMGVCGVSPSHGDLGIAGALIVAPGEPERSVLLARIRETGADRMPPLGSVVVDEAGAGWVEEWILTGCE